MASKSQTLDLKKRNFIWMLVLAMILIASPVYSAERVVYMNQLIECLATSKSGKCTSSRYYLVPKIMQNGIDDNNSFVVYTQQEIDVALEQVRKDLSKTQGELDKANELLEKQRKTIEEFSAALSKRIDGLPAALAADANAVALLREQLQAEFDHRYAPNTE